MPSTAEGSAGSGLGIAVPLPDSPPHYTEGADSASSSGTGFFLPPSVTVTRRRRPGGHEAFCMLPQNSLPRFGEDESSSSAAGLLQQEDQPSCKNESPAEVESEGSPSSPWYLFPETNESPAESPLGGLAGAGELAGVGKPARVEASSSAAEKSEWAIPLAPLPMNSPSPPVRRSSHRRPLPRAAPFNRLSTVNEDFEITAGTSMARWPPFEGSLLVDAQEPWLVEATFSTPPGLQQGSEEEKSWSAASPSPPSRSLLSFIENERILREEEEAEAAEAEAAVAEAAAESPGGDREETAFP